MPIWSKCSYHKFGPLGCPPFSSVTVQKQTAVKNTERALFTDLMSINKASLDFCSHTYTLHNCHHINNTKASFRRSETEAHFVR